MLVQLDGSDRLEDNEWAVSPLYPDGRRSFDAPRELLQEGALAGDVFGADLERDAGEPRRLAAENRWLLGGEG